MRYKVTFLVGVGAGYVLGARAGRERYESLARTARGFADTPAVQEAAGVLQAQASTLAAQARGKVGAAVGEKISDTLHAATEKVRPDSAPDGAPGSAGGPGSDEGPGPVRA